MEATVQVAIIGIFTTIVTTIGVVIAAIVNGKRERSNAAESAMERTLRERITLRDEQLADARQDIADRDVIIAARDIELAERKRKIEQLEEHLRLCREGRL